MEDGFFSMVQFDGPTSMVRFFKNQFTESLGPSPGVNQMWTKRYDHASKYECFDFFNIYSKKLVLNLKKSSVINLLSSSSLP